MIQPLRDRHRFAFLALAVIVPVVFVIGLVSRPTDPVATDSRTRDIDSAHARSLHWPHARISVEQLDGGRLRFVGDAEVPDPLLYCTREPVGERLPGDAVFVGEYASGTDYAVPQPCSPNANWVLVSGATRAVIDSAAIGVRP
jgi:hypothetical protein